MKRSLLAVVMVAGCGGAPSRPPVTVGAPPTPTPESAGGVASDPVIASTTIKLGWDRPYVSSLVFLDSRHALVTEQGNLVVVDLEARAVVGAPRALNSDRVASAWPRPHGHERQRELGPSVWSWDQQAQTLVGAVTVQTWQPVADRGLGAWAPALQPVPTHMQVPPGHGGRPLAILPGRRLMIAEVGEPGVEHSVQAFNLDTGAPVGSPIVTGGVTAATVAPDGERVALGTVSRGVFVITPATGAIATLPPGHASEVRALAFHPSLPVLATADGDEVRIWQLATEPATSSVLTMRAGKVAFSPDGKYLAVADGYGVVLLDATTHQRVGGPYRAADDASVDRLGFSPDARHLVVVHDGRTLIIHDLVSPGPATPAADQSWFARLQQLPVPPDVTPPPFASTGVIRGRVTIDGKPVARAKIVLRPADGEWPDARALPAITTRTGKDGRYTLRSVPTIRWSFRATAPRRGTNGGTVDLREHAERTNDVTLRPAVTLLGRVDRPDGKPAAGARVAFRGHMGALITAVAGRDGRFVFDHLSPDRYTLWARSADGAVGTTHLTAFEVGTKAVTIKLRPADGPDVIRVLVVDATGAPVAGATVTMPYSNEGVTDATGRYTLPFDAGNTAAREATACRPAAADGTKRCATSRLWTDAPGVLLIRLP